MSELPPESVNDAIQSPAPAAPPKRRAWLRGCAIGCGVLLLLLIVAGVACAIYLRHVGQEMRANAAQTVAEQYAAYEKAGAISEKNRPDFEALKKAASDPNATLFQIWLAMGTLRAAADDGFVDIVDEGYVSVTAKYLNEHPGLSVGQFGQFFKQYPDICDWFQRVEDGTMPRLPDSETLEKEGQASS